MAKRWLLFIVMLFFACRHFHAMENNKSYSIAADIESIEMGLSLAEGINGLALLIPKFFSISIFLTERIYFNMWAEDYSLPDSLLLKEKLQECNIIPHDSRRYIKISWLMDLILGYQRSQKLLEKRTTYRQRFFLRILTLRRFVMDLGGTCCKRVDMLRRGNESFDVLKDELSYNISFLKSVQSLVPIGMNIKSIIELGYLYAISSLVQTEAFIQPLIEYNHNLKKVVKSYYMLMQQDTHVLSSHYEIIAIKKKALASLEFKSEFPDVDDEIVNGSVCHIELNPVFHPLGCKISEKNFEDICTEKLDKLPLNVHKRNQAINLIESIEKIEKNNLRFHAESAEKVINTIHKMLGLYDLKGSRNSPTFRD